MAKELSPEVKLSLITKLQAYRQEARANRNFNGRTGEHGKPYFRNYPPEVRDAAWKHFSILCTRHKAKLEANGSLIGMIVATATRLALDELGLRQISRSGFHRLRAINFLKVSLGIQDKHKGKRYIPGKGKGNKNATTTTNLQKCNVSQLPLEC